MKPVASLRGPLEISAGGGLLGASGGGGLLGSLGALLGASYKKDGRDKECQRTQEVRIATGIWGTGIVGCSLGSRGEPPGGLLEAVLKSLGGRLGCLLGPLLGFLGASGGVFGASWGLFGASWGLLGSLLGRKARFFSSWSLSEAPLGPVLGAS